MKMNARKIILLLLDGLGDRSYPVLDHQTPLQSAQTPNLNELARMGSNGMFHASSMGLCLPSETAHYLLFGYEPETFPGRGLLEAVGAGLKFGDKDVLCLAHLCTVEFQKEVPLLTHGREEIKGDPKEMEELYAAITPYHTGGVCFTLKKTGRNNGILILNGGVSPHVSDSDPMTRGYPIAQVLPMNENSELEEARVTALALNKYLSWCHGILREHPSNRTRRKKEVPQANFLATQRCGRRIIQEPFHDRWGLRGMLIASGTMYAGLALELGMTFYRTQNSIDPEADIRDRLRVALNDTEHDFFHVHTKVLDEASHRGDPHGKQIAIEALDRGLNELVKAVKKREDLIVAATGDHSTPSISPLIHSGETVPIIVAGRNVRRDGVHSFDEVSAAQGCLGLLRGRELMLTLLNYADRSSLAGHRLGRRETPFFPKDYQPFTLKG